MGVMAVALDIFGDFGFSGGEDNYLYQDAQTCINFYPEIAGSPSAKTAVSLRGTPGLIQIVAAPGGGAPGNQSSAWPAASSITNLPVRGMWVLPGNTTALVVIANTCYLAKALSQGSTNTTGVITLTSVGTLNTYSGPVSIRDNNTGGYAFIVDGPNGYVYTIATQAFATIADTNFVGWGATTQAFIDGWNIFSANQTGSSNQQKFFTNAPIYTNTFDGTFFDLKDGASDNLVALMENKEQLWLFGERTTEIWYNAGGALFPFQRLGGALQQTGCKAPYSISRLKTDTEDCLIWFGRNELGENVVMKTQGFNTQVVSTPAVSNAIATYGITSDAIGFCYEEDGHQFYQLTFPSADKTWVYDSTMPPGFAWHQRASYDPYTNTFHRHRANCFMNFAGMRIVGDYQNGTLYQMTRNAYTDAGWPLRAIRRSPYIWDKDNRRRMHMSSLQVEFAPGVGNSIVTYPQPNQNTTGYTANAISFSTSSTWMDRGAALTGIVDGKQGSVSFLFKPGQVSGSQTILEIRNSGGGAVGFLITYTSSGKFQISGNQSGGTSCLSVITSNTYTSLTTYYLVQASWDLSTGTVNLYVNGTSDASSISTVNANISYTKTDADIGGFSGLNRPVHASLSEFWFTTSYLDFSSSANRGLFINSSGYPLFLGTTGQIPTGTSPIIYINGSAANAGTNAGTGGNFTVNGTFLNATSPSSPPTGTLTTGIGSNPQARLRLSRDYGTTYGEPIYSPLGQIGNYVNRTIWRKLGWTRGTVAEIEIIDPVKRDIVGATLKAHGD